MAQDVVAPRKQAQSGGGSVRLAAWRRRIVDLLPKSPALGPVEYTPMLVAYVVATVVAALVAAALVVAFRQDISRLSASGCSRSPCRRRRHDLSDVGLRCQQLPGTTRSHWTPSVFIHLGLAVTFGPVGAAVGAIAEPFGVSVRNHNGWFRTTFNVANEFLANVAAWLVFAVVNGAQVDGTGRALLRRDCAPASCISSLNSGFVAVVIHLSDRRVPIAR